MRSLRELLNMWPDPKMKETIRSLWRDRITGGDVVNIVNNEIDNNTTNIYQSISQIIRANQDNNHESFLIENTSNASETVESSWTVIPFNEQVGEFKAVVMIRNKATDTIITLMSLLSFDYSDAVDVVLQSVLITDAALSLTLGVNGSNILYATVSGMPTDNKRIHLCFERCVMSERIVLLNADFQFSMNMEAALAKYKLMSEAQSEFSLSMEAALSAYLNIPANFAFSLGMVAGLTKIVEEQLPVAFTMSTNSVLASWTVNSIGNTGGATLHWVVSGAVNATVDYNKPTFNFSPVGAKDIVVTSADNLIKVTKLWALTACALTKLNVTALVNMVELISQGGSLTSLILTPLVNLKYLLVNSNQLTELDVSNCPQMINMGVQDNQLTTLDVSNLVNLVTYLQVQNNQLTSIGTLNCPGLLSLLVSNNQLTTLDISSCTSLRTVYAYNNKLPKAVVDSMMDILISRGSVVGDYQFNVSSQSPAITPDVGKVSALQALGWLVTV